MIDALQILLWLAVPINYIYWIFIHNDPAHTQVVSNGSARRLPKQDRCA
jgi:hypothetical protein